MITFPGTKLATWRRPTAGAKLTVDTYLKQRPGSLLLYVYLFLVCFFFQYLFIYFWTCWVLLAAHRIFSCGLWDLLP